MVGIKNGKDDNGIPIESREGPRLDLDEELIAEEPLEEKEELYYEDDSSISESGFGIKFYLKLFVIVVLLFSGIYGTIVIVKNYKKPKPYFSSPFNDGEVVSTMKLISDMNKRIDTIEQEQNKLLLEVATISQRLERIEKLLKVNEKKEEE